MGVGREYFGQAGNKQASTDRFTMGLSGHGALLMTDTGSIHPQPRVRGQITVTGVNPVVVIRPSTRNAIFLENFNVTNGVSKFAFGAVSSQPVAFQYWVFDVASQAVKDPDFAGMGVQVFDPSVTLTYDAAMDTLDIQGLVEVAPSPSQTSANGNNVDYYDLATFASIPVPSGRQYGVAFCGAAYTFGTKSYGQYSQYPWGGMDEIPDYNPDPVITPPNANYVRTRLDTLWPGAQLYGDTLEVGMGQVEYFNGWTPVNGYQEEVRSYGVARFIVVDVTELSTAGLPTSPGTPTVQVNATERRVTTNGPATTTISPEATITISGGSAPYTIQWENVGGSSYVGANGSATSASFSTAVYQQQPDTSYSSIWRARVVTATGVVGYSPDVTFVHVAEAYSEDFTPNTLALVPLTLVSNANQQATSDVCDVVGFNQPITLRVERYNFSGAIDAAAVYVYTAPLGTTNWVHRGTFDPRGANGDIRCVDFQIDGPCRLHYVIDSVSFRGRKDYSIDLVVWRLGMPGREAVQISTGKRVTVTVDADNDYNRVAPISVPNLTGYVSNDPELYTDGRFFQVNGFAGSVYLRFQRNYYTLSQSGGIVTRRLLVFHSTTGSGGPWTSYFVGAGTPEAANPFTDVQCSPGDWFYVQGWITTGNGRGSASWGNDIYWHDGVTIQGHLANFQISGTVDNDDNFYAPDYNLDAIDWPGQGANTNESVGAWVGEYRALSGINQNIRLRVEIRNVTGLNGFPRGDVGNFYIISESRGNLGDPTRGGQQGVSWVGNPNIYADVQPGERIRFYTDVATGSGRRDTGFDVFVYNDTTGAFIDHHYSAGIVDADDNYNRLSFPAWDHFTVPGGANSTTINNNGRNMDGIINAHLLRIVITNFAGSMDDGYIRLKNFNFVDVPSSEIRGQHRYAGGNGEFNAWVNPGEHIFFDATAISNSGARNATFTVQVYDQSMGGRYLTGFNVATNAGTADTQPNAINFPSMYGSVWNQELVTVNSQVFTLTGFDTPITMRTYLGFVSHNFQSSSGGGQVSVGDGPGSGTLSCHVYRNGGYIGSMTRNLYGYEYAAETYEYMDFAMNPGDTIQWVNQLASSPNEYGYGHEAGVQGNIYLDSLTGGNRIGQFAHSSSISIPNTRPGGGINPY